MVAVALLDGGVGAAAAHRRVEDGVGALGKDLAPGVDVGLRVVRGCDAKYGIVVVVVHDRGASVNAGHGVDGALVDAARDVRVAALGGWRR